MGAHCRTAVAILASALAAAMNRFAYLQVSLAIVLVLIGAKVALVPFGIKIDTMISLLATIAILAGGIIYSLWKTRGQPDIPADTNPRQGQLEP